MTEILFYHLERRPLDAVLPGLVEKSLERGWRVAIRADTSERAEAIDNLLWTYNDQSFLPHAQAGDGNAKDQPVLITTEDGNANDASILFLVGGAPPPPWDSPLTKALTRIALLFDGRDPAMRDAARAAWRGAKEAGHDVTYWKDSNGKWEKQG